VSVDVLRDDDRSCVAWRGANGSGHVLNIQRTLTSSDARVHYAWCSTIAGTSLRGGTSTGPYVKACSLSLPELGARARQVSRHPVRRLPAAGRIIRHVMKPAAGPAGALGVAPESAGWEVA
jgi:hypothetical protein